MEQNKSVEFKDMIRDVVGVKCVVIMDNVG